MSAAYFSKIIKMIWLRKAINGFPVTDLVIIFVVSSVNLIHIVITLGKCVINLTNHHVLLGYQQA